MDIKLKSCDRKFFLAFFQKETKWMKEHSLLCEENIESFKKHFFTFMKQNNLTEENIPCKLFLLTLEHEKISCMERKLIESYNSKNLKHCKYAKECYITDNPRILFWYTESHHW